VNALSNAKRALHCQIDSILFCTGFWTRAHERHWDFQAKADLLRDMKVVAPGILSRINRHRNEIEHEYVGPPHEEELMDLIEVVDLFIAGTRHLATTRYESIDFEGTFARRRGTFSIALLGDEEIEVYLRSLGRSRPMKVTTFKSFRQMQVALFRALHRESALSSF